MNRRAATEAIVVGGSSAGLFAARGLAKAGIRTCLCESRSEIQPEPRSLIVTSAYRDWLGGLGESAVVNEIRRFELFADGKTAEIELRRPDLIIDRALLIPRLAEAAATAGVEIRLGCRVSGLGADGVGLRVSVDRRDARPAHQERSSLVIAADGASSRVARMAGLPKQRVLPLIQAIVRPPADLEPDATRVWFVPEATPYFYWLIPESRDRGALGIIGAGSGRQARDLLDGFLRRQGLDVIGYQAGRIPEYTGWSRAHRRLDGGEVWAVGDAAGHVKVTTVGGVVNGIWGAQGVCDAICTGRTGSPALRSLRRELDAHLWIRRALHSFEEDDYRQLLELLDATACSTLGRITRDDTARLLWNLLRRQPRFAWLGLRGLLGGRDFPSGRLVGEFSQRTEV